MTWYKCNICHWKGKVCECNPTTCPRCGGTGEVDYIQPFSDRTCPIGFNQKFK